VLPSASDSAPAAEGHGTTQVTTRGEPSSCARPLKSAGCAVKVSGPTIHGQPTTCCQVTLHPLCCLLTVHATRVAVVVRPTRSGRGTGVDPEGGVEIGEVRDLSTLALPLRTPPEF
jgi:hypothetical protein